MTTQVQLSDGNYVEVPDDAQPDAIGKIVDQAESQLAEMYGKQAADKNGPVQAGSKVYSATTAYPNTVMGNTMAWLDHNAGGNWLNRNVVHPADRFIAHPITSIEHPSTMLDTTTPVPQPLEASLGRMESNAVAGVADLPAAVYNTAKHYTPLGTNYDAPYIGQNIRSEVGTPELSPDAPFLQRAAEATGTAILSGGKSAGPTAWNVLSNARANLPSAYSAARDAALSTIGTYASDVGGKIGGEAGSLIAPILALVGSNAAGKGVAKAVAPTVRAENAPEIWTSATNIRPSAPGQNFQGLTSAPAIGTPDFSTYTPNFAALANPTGQRLAASFSSIPISGEPIEAATERTRSFIQNARDAAANDLMGARGTGGPPSEPASAATIGPVATEGAQTAISAINRDQSQRQQSMANLMTERNQQLTSGNPRLIMASPPGSREPGSAEVPVPNTINTGFNAVSGNQRDQPTTQNVRSRVSELQQAAPGGSAYERGTVPLPAIPTSTWQALTDWVGNLTRSMAQTGKPAIPNDIAASLKAAANAEKERAADAISPGAGAQFRQNNESYARAQASLDELRKLGGDELGQSGRFTDVPSEQEATRQITGNMQSPSAFDETLLHPAFPPENRLNIAGQLVSTLGNTSQGGFRPEYFTDALRGAKGVRPGLEALTVGPTGAPHGALNVLDNAANIAQNFSTPISRFGLIKSLGSAAVVKSIMENTAKGVQLATRFKPAQYVAAPLIGRAYATGLESEALRRAMARQPQDWSTLYNRVPAAASVINTAQPYRASLAP